jgi:hypothetical protein
MTRIPRVPHAGDSRRYVRPFTRIVISSALTGRATLVSGKLGNASDLA